MRTRGMTLAAAALTTAAIALPATAVPAAAAPASATAAPPVQVDCSGSGGKGSAAWNWTSKDEFRSIVIRGKDTKAEGLHPAIRIYWYDGKGRKSTTPWLHVRDGVDKWNTPTIWDRDGLKSAGIEIDLFRRNTRVGDVCSESKKNPRY
ncbi:hypothetical protein [Streptomyces sp. XD-27]|uniref:hypothetical protein n=1 Tax=Streptomyces sp. XD-27 TaxID=3062779 RepID=UPI0026F46330|nr:hypothetical protein [Streptomyces sp. XD-27]WKX70611.1 hypothetical protein Q3Y56_12440 [Streptomyces sp. XD-27]